ncbi:GntR family transcriptional regulator [Ornithinimicrobium cavernae]|uniref:GntR family transcriptional regulator n=1 Tax=Ornithinimicrobium cavernae TaxID=2666047 RepID=UPI00137A31AB|nr:GntR family transcriptional regulator [Ornithinimicrobium cavernae]
MTEPAGVESEAQDAAERAYRAVLALIVTGEASEGTWLRETTLAEQIGVSRTPVRQALNRLAAEGAVELRPHRGAQVASFSPEEMASLYDLRARFEPLAARLAVERLSAQDVEELVGLAAQMEALVGAGEPDPAELARLNDQFHAVFIREAGNRHLTLAIQTVTRPVFVARTFQTYSRHALERSMRHHAELVDAARLRDGEWAEAIMRAHILAARHASDEQTPQHTRGDT